MNDFEKRLYKHWIYTSNLYNIVQDLINDLFERGFNCHCDNYKSGQYISVIIDNYDETFEEVLEFLLGEYDPNYYSSLGYVIEEEDKINFYIKI